MASPYTVRPELWAETPIIRGINPLTGLIEGDDSGYRNVQTLGENSSPLVIPNVLIRASYDGEDEFGILDPAIALAGGLPDGKFVVREQVARELEKADENLHQITGGEYRLCALDGFRSWKRQAAGFTRMLGIQMNRMGLTADNVDDRVVDFLRAGNAADGTFAWVNANTSARSYLLLAQELETDSTFMDQIREFASTLTSMTLPDAIQETLYTYITVSANSGIGRAANRGVPLVFEGNAHAGGGAVDVFLVNKHGMPVNIVPFDYPGCEAGMDWMEDDANYQQYLKRVQEDELLGRHFIRMGYTQETFTPSEWRKIRDANRLRYHLAMARGWTYYSSDHGGENWHLEPGNKGYDPWTGNVETCEVLTAGSMPDSGNPGHTLQKLGPKAVAVWGGASGHRQAQAQYGLEV